MTALYEYAVFKEEKRNADDNIVEAAQIVVPVTTVLAEDDEQAQMIAARAIPEDEMGDIGRLTVVVRLF